MNLLNARLLAFLAGLLLAGVTAAFLRLIDSSIGLPVVLAVCLVVFAATYLLMTLMLEFLIFREINKIQEMVNQLETKAGSAKSIDENINPIRQVRERIQRFARLKQDEINELRKLEAFRREFLADVSHELKTPIFAAQGFVHTLLDGAMEDKKVRKKFLKKAAKSLDGLDMLVHDLLTLSQMETGEIKMHLEVFSLFELAEEVREQLEDKASKKDITIEIINELGQATVSADPRRIYQVLLNLVNNAVKYCGDKAQVRIVLEPWSDGEEVLVTVEDNGPGIPEEHLSRIFERFYRVEKSRSKDKGGTGLGLAIVKHVLEAHHSQIKVQSEENEGTSFMFTLPLELLDSDVAENPINEYVEG